MFSSGVGLKLFSTSKCSRAKETVVSQLNPQVSPGIDLINLTVEDEARHILLRCRNQVSSRWQVISRVSRKHWMPDALLHDHAKLDENCTQVFGFEFRYTKTFSSRTMNSGQVHGK